jgi:hypothetical protein
MFGRLDARVVLAAVMITQSGLGTPDRDDDLMAFDVRPGDRLYLPPEERVHIW